MGDSRPTQKTTYSQATLRAEPKDCNKRLGSYPTRIPTQKVFVIMICNDGGNLTIGASFRESPNPKEIPNEISLQDKNIGLTNNNLDTPENQMGVDSINQEINLSKDSGINTPEAEMKIQTRSRKQAIPETQTNRLEARQ
ncbi:hypothetical protein BB559_007483 [Furculomyces boomerangus]|uniref:Uncharacterized protein n=1 Tax=Furculomyces boomerangus TaxID=61424 RepID=A0A2T9XX81_9FUNG|nr:hypothetical protein BB559_007483 [Furculomyces boomerangus]